jgi:peptidoglycan/LPS O-acetylase OafA/YrhL
MAHEISKPMTGNGGVTHLIRSISADNTHLDDPGFSSLLDAMRWIAALCVVTTHVSWRILVPLQEAQDSSLFTTLFYVLSSFGHQAVIIFFVLSGYLVGGKGTTAVTRAQFDLRNYLSARTARLYAVLLPALMLTAIADWLSIKISGGNGFHALPAYDNLNSWTAFISVLMLQPFYGPALGSNAPLWSLSFEFWFYMVFAVSAQATIKHGLSRWAYALFAILIILFLGKNFICYFLMWLIGLVAAIVPRHQTGRLGAIVATGFFIAAIPSSHFTDRVMPRLGSDLFQSFAAGVLLWTLKASNLSLMIRLKSLNAFLADFSYSLYAVHYPLVLLFLTLLGGPATPSGYSMRLPFGPASFGLFVLVVSACVLCGWLFSLVTERKTRVLRGWILKILRYNSASNRLDVVGRPP